MTNEVSYTVEIYKADKRTKSGERLVQKLDIVTNDLSMVEDMYKAHCKKNKGHRFAIYETYVTRRNALNGKEIKERYDTPYYCSASSESYWSM